MSFADQWRRAAEPADDFDPPNGGYTVRVTEASAFAGNDGRQWAKAVLKVLEGPHAGREFDHFFGLNSEAAIRIAYEAFITYGLDPAKVDSFEDLQTEIVELAGTIATVSVSHKDNYRNVKVSGSRTDESDIPNDYTVNGPSLPAKATGVPAPQTSFAAAAKGAPESTDDVPF